MRSVNIQPTVTVAAIAERDGKYLVSGCDDKSVKLWDVSGFKSNDSSLTEANAQ